MESVNAVPPALRPSVHQGPADSSATGATGGSDFRLVSGGYRFNWNTSTASSTGRGCYSVLITLNDGSAPKLTNAVQLK
jgi:hypothetical protein